MIPRDTLSFIAHFSLVPSAGLFIHSGAQSPYFDVRSEKFSELRSAVTILQELEEFAVRIENE